MLRRVMALGVQRGSSSKTIVTMLTFARIAWCGSKSGLLRPPSTLRLLVNGRSASRPGQAWHGRSLVISVSVFQKKKTEDFKIKAEFTEDLAESKVGHKSKVSIRDYGGIGLLFHGTLCLISVGASWALLSAGVPLEDYTDNYSFLVNYADAHAAGSTFYKCFAIFKYLAVYRLCASIVCVPLIVHFARANSILKPLKAGTPLNLMLLFGLILLIVLENHCMACKS